jgi:acyl-CoA synthetase (AMP-forming)/AMP-acid ligase II
MGNSSGATSLRAQRLGGRDHHLLPRPSRPFQGAATVIFGPLPKTSTGKIQKFLLRERARESKE